MTKQVKSKERVNNFGEVFTAEREVNAMLDLVKDETSRIESRFLEPACGNGNFLIEILRRKLSTVKDKFQQNLSEYERNSIIAISSIHGVDILEDNVIESRNRLYSYFYEQYTQLFSSKCKPELLNIVKTILDTNIVCGNTLTMQFNTKFDVIIGNPPYQQSDGGHGKSSKPIYNLFIEKAKSLNPRYVVMIIPARWFAGGKGLDNFRHTMLNDPRISKLVDFPIGKEVFPAVDIAGGVCYFLWDKYNSNKECEITTVKGGTKSISNRRLNEFDIFIRNSEAVSIIRKVTQCS